ncbi:hypothetical protein GTG28_02335 [Vibrio sp. OCN044]|uniref:Uncharacterized protein n=1 Tax=Vibrio tetraodonis subsp. pristinus TaxID=2695891 RepID=A0A6L8LTT3_9VIBR|nr:hypothetical protein [Vibrio tetraodonis]MYM58050.1 hypothetical protein [Vibrio tetraodonis subsp. pristinus]
MNELDFFDNENLYFNNNIWRKNIDDFCDLISIKYGKNFKGICPWGFEVFNDTNFLKKNIRRYFCYFSVDDMSMSDYELNEMSKKINFEFYEYIKSKYSLWAQNIVCLLSNESVHKLQPDDYVCGSQDKLLSVTLRKSDNILDSYADYIICSLSSLNNLIGEVRTYKENMVFRWRTYQLYLIIEEVFKDFIPRLSKFEERLVKVAITFTDNAIQPFYSIDDSCHPIEKVETALFEDFIFKRVKIIADAIKSSDGNVVNASCFHTTDELSLDIDNEIYEYAVKLIRDTYRGFMI